MLGIKWKKQGFQPLLVNEQKSLLEKYQNFHIIYVFDKIMGKWSLQPFLVNENSRIRKYMYFDTADKKTPNYFSLTTGERF